jgi:hypothetical protein
LIDLKFTEIHDLRQHITIPVQDFDEVLFINGIGLLQSSVELGLFYKASIVVIAGQA